MHRWGGEWCLAQETLAMPWPSATQEQQPDLLAAILPDRGGRGEPVHLFLAPRQWHAEMLTHP